MQNIQNLYLWSSLSSTEGECFVYVSRYGLFFKIVIHTYLYVILFSLPYLFVPPHSLPRLSVHHSCLSQLITLQNRVFYSPRQVSHIHAYLYPEIRMSPIRMESVKKVERFGNMCILESDLEPSQKLWKKESNQEKNASVCSSILPSIKVLIGFTESNSTRVLTDY